MKRQAITLGRVGILLPIAIIIPFLGSLAGLAAMILLVLSHYYFSKFYEQPVIFRKALIGTVIQVAGNIIGSIIIVMAVGSALFSFSGDGGVDYTNYQEMASLLFDSGLTIFGTVIILAGLIVGFYFVYTAMASLAEKTGVKLFKTAGLLYFIGAIGIIVFFLGFIVMFAAWIIHVVAYFSIQYEDKPTA